MASGELRQIPEDIPLEPELPEELLEPPELPGMQADVDASRRQGWEHLRMRRQSRTDRPSSGTHRLLYGSSVTHSRVVYTQSYPVAQDVAGKEAKMKMSAGARARVIITRSVATCRGNRRYRHCLAR